jgi:hypothetical protein
MPVLKPAQPVQQEGRDRRTEHQLLIIAKPGNFLQQQRIASRRDALIRSFGVTCRPPLPAFGVDLVSPVPTWALWRISYALCRSQVSRLDEILMLDGSTPRVIVSRCFASGLCGWPHAADSERVCVPGEYQTMLRTLEIPYD